MTVGGEQLQCGDAEDHVADPVAQPNNQRARCHPRRWRRTDNGARRFCHPSAMSPTLPTGAAVTALHDALLDAPGWPAREPAARDDGLWLWIQTNHRYNCLLWAEEDLARRTQVADAEIAANKRAIDRYNQVRNDATERVDEVLLTALGLVDPGSARTDSPVSTVRSASRLNSETAGSMVD